MLKTLALAALIPAALLLAACDDEHAEFCRTPEALDNLKAAYLDVVAEKLGKIPLEGTNLIAELALGFMSSNNIQSMKATLDTKTLSITNIVPTEKKANLYRCKAVASVIQVATPMVEWTMPFEYEIIEDTQTKNLTLQYNAIIDTLTRKVRNDLKPPPSAPKP